MLTAAGRGVTLAAKFPASEVPPLEGTMCMQTHILCAPTYFRDTAQVKGSAKNPPAERTVFNT